jgi:hypothetical protein
VESTEQLLRLNSVVIEAFRFRRVALKKTVKFWRGTIIGSVHQMRVPCEPAIAIAQTVGQFVRA